MWTRGSKKNGFQVQVFNLDRVLVDCKEGFKTAEDADRWGEAKQRAIFFPNGNDEPQTEIAPDVLYSELAELKD